MTVADVNIYHRTDCCQNRLSSGDGAQVIISDTSDYAGGTVCGRVATSTVDVVDCGNGQGRYVTVLHANDYITICEIEVTAWAPPMGAQMLGGDGPLVRNTQLNDVTIPLDCKYRRPLRLFQRSKEVCDRRDWPRHQVRPQHRRRLGRYRPLHGRRHQLLRLRLSYPRRLVLARHP